MKKLIFGALAFIGALTIALQTSNAQTPHVKAEIIPPEPTQKQSAADDERKRLMREMARKGGLKSVETRRRKKSQQQETGQKVDQAGDVQT